MEHVLCAKIGESCSNETSINQCEQLPFQSVDCMDGRCEIAIGQAHEHDACINDAQCSSSGLSTCTNGLCMGVMVESSCNRSLDCSFGHFCNVDSVCMPLLAEGERCIQIDAKVSLESEVCQLGLTCGLNGTCVPMFSVPIGQPCFISDECEIGNFCRLDNTTFDIARFGVARQASGVCALFPAEVIPCATVQDCSDLGTTNAVSCDCDPFSADKICQLSTQSLFGLFFEPFTAQEFDTILACYNAHNCSLFSSGVGSCAEQFCPREMSCLLAALEVYGPINQREFDSGCRIQPNFTCAGLIPVQQQCADDICCDALETPDRKSVV